MKLFAWLPSDLAATILAELKPEFRDARMEEATQSLLLAPAGARNIDHG
jgi:hypothetical protein